MRAWLEREIDLGLAVLPVAAMSPAPARPSILSRADSPVRTPTITQDAARPSRLPELLVEPAIRDAASLHGLREVLGDCHRCKLAGGRTQIVFGVGNARARLMFVGEGPGEDEDRQGEPFVGKAGKLLTDIITRGMGLERADVYIANVIKCRPPGNRNPEPDEIVACEPFLRRQIELVAPEVLVSLGTFATQALLGDRTPISKRRGRWHEFDGIPLMPTFHPAYLLRTPGDKRLVWEDIKQVMLRLGLPLPAGRGGGRA